MFIFKQGECTGIFYKETSGMHNCNECKAVKSHAQMNTGELWKTGITMTIASFHHC